MNISKDDGVRRHSPAIHRCAFCYFHWLLRDHKLPVAEKGYEPPIIDSEASVILASAQIMRTQLNVANRTVTEPRRR